MSRAYIAHMGENLRRRNDLGDKDIDGRRCRLDSCGSG